MTTAATEPPPDRVVFFSTGSAQKLQQYRYLLAAHGLSVEAVRPLPSLHEPQVDGSGAGAETVLVELPLKDLARFAARSATFPLIVEDTMLFIEHFNRDWTHPMLPGPDTKRWWHALGNEGLLELLADSDRRQAQYVCQLGVLTREGRYHTFRAEVPGRISKAPRSAPESWAAFPQTNPTYFHQIFVPERADQTLAEMTSDTFECFDYRRRAVDEAVQTLRDAARPAQQTVLFAA